MPGRVSDTAKGAHGELPRPSRRSLRRPAKPKDAPSGAKDTSPKKTDGDNPGGGKGDGGGKSDGGGESCATKNSFVPGTKVVLADGSTKAIEDLKVGDEVLATDPKTGETAAKPIEATILGEGDKDLVQITVKVGASDEETIIATDGHPFWVESLHKWVPASELSVDALLRTAAGTYVKITALDPDLGDGPAGPQPDRHGHPHVLRPRRHHTSSRTQLRRGFGRTSGSRRCEHRAHERCGRGSGNRWNARIRHQSST
ncbi:Hint domain-containing protein [Actinoplanes sp. NPDC049316]|uniref:Hint domain-containing protein n=1 Tax=Actinoplanes sp. NPDC049316 TaxID=3154727 RepID=UPI0034193DBF